MVLLAVLENNVVDESDERKKTAIFDLLILLV